jgi:drug/metabolite transporter (DMT)-like permease
MEPTRDTPSRRADGAALLVVTIWGVSFAFQKIALDEIDVLAFTAVRYTGMLALAWAVLAWLRLRGHSIAVAREDVRRVVIAGVLGYTVYIPGSTLGLSLTTPFSTTLLMGMSPLFAALMLGLAGAERITIRHVGGMLTAFAGLVVFLSHKLHLALHAASLGDLLVLFGAACFAGYSILSKPLGGRYAFPVVIGYTCAAGAVPVIVATAPWALAFDWSRVSAAGWASFAWTVVVPVYLAWGLWAWAAARTGVARTSVLMYLVPVIGGVTAWVVYGEAFDATKLGGAALILSGLALTRRASGAPEGRASGAPEVSARRRPSDIPASARRAAL